MQLRTIFNTIISKVSILGLNFLIVILTSQFWGAEGRGIISILMADLALIVIINNIFSGSSIAFHSARTNINEIISPAILWIILVSVICTTIFFFLQNSINPLYLMLLTILTSLTAFNLSAYIGKQKLTNYNLFSFLIPLFILAFILIFKYLWPHKNQDIYFWGYGAAYFIIWVASWLNLNIKPILKDSITIKKTKSIFNYGFKNELSYFLQFLNYRFSYFIILYYWDIKHVGVFSIGIALAESVWVISKSLSLVQYSKVINTDVSVNITGQTNKLAALSTLATIIIGIGIVFIPGVWFGKIFGEDFSHVKPYILMLYPGIVFLAFSNVYAHHLAGKGIMKPLVLKSAWGLITTVTLAFMLIPGMGLTGACITTSASHLVSAAYTYYSFQKNIKT